jgi:hypothetical protein
MALTKQDNKWLAGNMATTPGHLLGDANDEPNRRTEVA